MSLFSVKVYDRRHMDVVAESGLFETLEQARMWQVYAGQGEGYFTVVYETQPNSGFELVWDFESKGGTENDDV